MVFSLFGTINYIVVIVVLAPGNHHRCKYYGSFLPWLCLTSNSIVFLLMVAHNCHKLTPTVEITSHTKRHTQCYSIESKDVKKDTSNYVKVSQKKSKMYEKVKLYAATKLSPSNVTKNKSPAQVASNNFAKILICLSVYISLYHKKWIEV